MQGRSRENTLKMVTRLAPGSESRGVVPDRRGERSRMRVPVAAAAPCLQHSQSRAPRFPPHRRSRGTATPRARGPAAPTEGTFPAQPPARHRL